MFRIESLLSARLFLRPHLNGERIYFESNLSGHISLYAMNFGGSVPEPLLPPNIALHNPHLIGGKPFYVFPKLGKIIVMIDNDGDEKYQPMAIPMEGGYPEPTFNNFFQGYQAHLMKCDPEKNILYFVAESLTESMVYTYQGNLETGELTLLGKSPWGLTPDGVNPDHSKVAMVEGYETGDHVLFFWEKGKPELRLLYGVPLDQRGPQTNVPLNNIAFPCFSPSERGIVLITSLFNDAGSLGYLDLQNPENIKPISIKGIAHSGLGELVELEQLHVDRYLVTYNIDGCSWAYEGKFDEGKLEMSIEKIICGNGEISNGALEAIYHEPISDTFTLTFSTATSPTQIYTVQGNEVRRHTNERILGLPSTYFSPGEDASFDSYDGTRISARLYMPSPELKYSGRRPVVYYIHGGPQSQERPDFAWFSMPLIQFLTLNGFAVFVPNVRGSSGYGLTYTRQVDHDWGGKDRLDHVHAMTQVLPKDTRLDVKRAAVVGRSYGGYMTLMQVGKHPELWSAAVDMFGPYDLITFSERIPETWKTYFKMILGDPNDEKDRPFLIDRSPCTHLHNLSCPMLVIQGKNDPRVVERESSDLVKDLRQKGKEIEYLMFENEGHDVLKYENRVTCYNAITDFFTKYLQP